MHASSRDGSARRTISRRGFVRLAALGAASAFAVPHFAASPVAARPHLSAPVRQEKATLRYWHPVGAGVEKQGEFFQQFEAANPQFAIQEETFPFEQYDDKVAAAMQAGQGPDILMVNSVTVGAFIEKGFLSATDDLLAASTAVKQDMFFPGLWSHVVYQGKSYGLPIDTGTRALYYHKGLFEKAGLQPPTNWDELKMAVEKLTVPGEQFGYSYAGGVYWSFLYEHVGVYTIQNQADIIAPDLSASLVNEAPVLEAFEMLVEFQRKGFCPQDAPTGGYEDYRALFKAGKLAMFTDGFWAIPVLKDLGMMPEEYGITRIKGKQYGSSTGGWLMCISSKTPNREAAWRFLELVVQPEQLARFTNLMPATIEANKLALQDPIYQVFKDLLPFARHPIYLNPYLPEMAKELQVEGQSALLGQKSAKQALDDLDVKFEEMLKQITR